MSKFLSKPKLFLIYILIAIPLAGIASASLEVKGGILDLRGVSYEAKQEIKFNGEWEFYWDQLLSSADIKVGNFSNKKLVDVPSIWTEYKIDGMKLPAKGAATYRMRILIDTSVNELAFKLGSYATAFALYVDGNKLSSAGKVSLDEKLAQPGYNPGVVSFCPSSDTVELILHISNYHYSKGGFWNSYGRIGNESNIRNSWNTDLQLSILIIGCILIFAFYHLGLFFMSRHFKYTLYFSLFCIIIIARILVINEIFILHIFPNFSWVAIIKIEYLTLIFGALLFSLFIYKFYIEEYSKLFLKSIVLANIVLGLLILLTPTYFFTKFLLIYQLDVVVGGFYISYVVYKALRKNRASAKILFVGFSVLLLSMINDILHVHRIVETGLIAAYGFLFFILSQSLMLSARFTRLLVKSNMLADKLEVSNINLEKEVEERTSKIVEQNSILNKQNSEITSSIAYASNIQSAVVNSVNEANSIVPNNFIFFKPKQVVSGDFCWFKEIEFEGAKYKFIAVVDCTGHGVPGAFMSILGTLFLNKAISEIKGKPQAAAVLNILRTEVKTILNQYSDNTAVKDGMDMALTIIDYSNMQVQFAGANNPMYIVRNNNGAYTNTIEEYKGDPMPIGIYIKERDEFTNHTVGINENDIIYLFSDGYYDQFGGPNGTKLMKNTFKNIILENVDKSLHEQKRILEEELVEWQGNYEQIDDITVVGIKV